MVLCPHLNTILTYVECSMHEIDADAAGRTASVQISSLCANQQQPGIASLKCVPMLTLDCCNVCLQMCSAICGTEQTLPLWN